VIETLAIFGYRSIRNLVLPLDRLNVVTGANGSGKSSLYRALRLLGDAALNSVVSSLAREGGLSSTLWAGPEKIGSAVRRGEFAVEGINGFLKLADRSRRVTAVEALNLRRNLLNGVLELLHAILFSG